MSFIDEIITVVLPLLSYFKVKLTNVCDVDSVDNFGSKSSNELNIKVSGSVDTINVYTSGTYINTTSSEGETKEIKIPVQK